MTYHERTFAMYSALCLFMLAAIAIFDPHAWHTYLAEAPVRIIGIAGTITVLLQLLKRLFPTIGGWYAIAINVTLAVAGVLVFVSPEQFWAVATWAHVLEAALAAAGVHGTVKALTSGTDAPNPAGINTDPLTPPGQPWPTTSSKASNAPYIVPSPGGPTMKRTLPAIVLGISFLALSLSGCKQVTATAPTTATTPYIKAATYMDDFSADLVQAQQIEIGLHKGGAIDDPTHKTIEDTFSTIAGYGTQLDSLILVQASSTTITTKINSLLTSLNSIIASTGALDTNTAAQIKNAITLMEQLLTNVTTLFPVNVGMTGTQPQEHSYGPSDDRGVGRAAAYARLADLQPSRSQRHGAAEATGGYHFGCQLQFRPSADQLAVLG
jgi:hypothetical protein